MTVEFAVDLGNIYRMLRAKALEKSETHLMLNNPSRELKTQFYVVSSYNIISI